MRHIGLLTFGLIAGCGFTSNRVDETIVRVSLFAPGGARTLAMKVGDTLRLNTYAVLAKGDSLFPSPVASTWATRPANVVKVLNDIGLLTAVGTGSTAVVVTTSYNADSIRVVVQ